MTKFEISTIALIFITMASGLVAFGKLQEKISQLNPPAIHKLIDEKFEKIKKELDQKLATASVTAITKEFHVAIQQGTEPQAPHRIPLTQEAAGPWDACFLTRVAGKFEGGRETVAVVRNEQDWYLQGSSLQRQVAASARCLTYQWTMR